MVLEIYKLENKNFNPDLQINPLSTCYTFQETIQKRLQKAMPHVPLLKIMPAPGEPTGPNRDEEATGPNHDEEAIGLNTDGEATGSNSIEEATGSNSIEEATGPNSDEVTELNSDEEATGPNRDEDHANDLNVINDHYLDHATTATSTEKVETNNQAAVTGPSGGRTKRRFLRFLRF